MAAIHLARLRKQVVELAEYFFEPQRFDFHFTQLMDFYSNRTIKPGKPTSSNKRIKTYQVQDPVLRALLAEISPIASKNPKESRSLAEFLWKEMVLEKRIFAIRLLGLLPIEDAGSSFALIEDWAQICNEDLLLEEISSHPLLVFHEENWELFIKYLNKWLGSESKPLVRLSMLSLITILEDRTIIDLPPIFTLLTPHFSKPTFTLRTYLNQIFKLLSRQSPDEIMFLIRQIHSSQEKPDKNFLWLLKQNKENLPEKYLDSLESMILKQP